MLMFILALISKIFIKVKIDFKKIIVELIKTINIITMRNLLPVQRAAIFNSKKKSLLEFFKKN